MDELKECIKNPLTWHWHKTVVLKRLENAGSRKILAKLRQIDATKMKHEDKMDLERAIELASKPEHMSMIRKIGISAMMLIGLGSGFKGPDVVGTLKKEVKPTTLTQESSYRDQAYNHFAHVVQKTSDGNAWAGDKEATRYHNKGLMYWKEKMYNEAIGFFKQAIAEKEDPASYGMIAQCILDMNGDPNEALKFAQKDWELNTHRDQDSLIHGVFARAYARSKQCDLAKKHIKKYEALLKASNSLNEGAQKYIDEVNSYCK